MPGLTKTILRKIFNQGPPKAFVKSIGSQRQANKAWRGFKQQATSNKGGPDSIVAWLPMAAAEKAFGKKKVRGASWKYVSAPALKADMAAGAALQKIPGAKKLFTTSENIPWGNPQNELLKNVSRPSALAPFTKLRDVAEPIIIGVGAEKALQKLHDSSQQKMLGATQNPQTEKGQGAMNKRASDGKLDGVMTKQALANNMHDEGFREKVASALVRLHEDNKNHEKRAHALKLLYKQAELGHSHVPQTFSELEEKLASLINQDLSVLEKALELAGGTLGLGELAPKSDAGALNAEEKFQAAVVGESF